MKTNLFILFQFALLFPLAMGSQQSVDIPKGMVLIPGNDKIKSFYMDKYEVTIAEFHEFVKATGYVTVAEKIGGTKRTVPGNQWVLTEHETWRTHAYYAKKNIGLDMALEESLQNTPVLAMAPEHVLAYAKWAGKRIPTYNEWVHAATAGKSDYPFQYPGSNKIRDVAWYEANTDNYFPETVGTKKPNELGIYDLAGNASELVYSSLKPGEFRIVGGSFVDSKSSCEIGKVANIPVAIDRPLCCLGIRLVKDL